MAKSVEGTAQRRKLLGEIGRLAQIAIFGTLSETYRTCGRAGCHCQSDGPKHGPHLNVSYRGEKGCLRELAELNKERNLQRAREADSQ